MHRAVDAGVIESGLDDIAIEFVAADGVLMIDVGAVVLAGERKDAREVFIVERGVGLAGRVVAIEAGAIRRDR